MTATVEFHRVPCPDCHGEYAARADGQPRAHNRPGTLDRCAGVTPIAAIRTEARPTPRPCAAGCGTLTVSTTGRSVEQDWYCPAPACQAAAAARRAAKYRARRPRKRVRVEDRCERCGGPYWPMPGQHSPDALCGKPACKKERHRRAYLRRAAA